MYDNIESITRKNFKTLKIHDDVYVMAVHSDYLTIEWDSNPVNDMLADSIVSLILQIEANIATHALIGFFFLFFSFLFFLFSTHSPSRTY